MTVTWFDLVVPRIRIEFDENDTKLTAVQNSLFYLEALNFSIDSI